MECQSYLFGRRRVDHPVTRQSAYVTVRIPHRGYNPWFPSQDPRATARYIVIWVRNVINFNNKPDCNPYNILHTVFTDFRQSYSYDKLNKLAPDIYLSSWGKAYSDRTDCLNRQIKGKIKNRSHFCSPELWPLFPLIAGLNIGAKFCYKIIQ